MLISERLAQAKETLYSFEIVPPARGKSGQEILDVVETLQPLNPAWIDVTSHSSTAYFRERPDGALERKTFRKRPGTLGICGIIQNRYRIDTVAHLLCLGFTKQETEDALIELNFLGIHNVLALRGDTPNFQKNVPRERQVNQFAADLVEQVHNLKQGQFLEDLDDTEPLRYCVGVAGYPEKHFESPSLRNDVANLKKKVDAGAEYVVTQMFFDNQKFFTFEKMCREAGITIPIIPGLKVLRSMPQLTSLPKTFHIDLPDELVEQVQSAPDKVAEIGKAWTLKQCRELLEAKVPSLHFYVLNDAPLVAGIVRELQGKK
jgi:methylenetetrahydrofolate reductase (NADPH)